MKNILKVKNLSVDFKLNHSLLDFITRKSSHTLSAVSNLSFEVAESEIYGIIGESGSGKTTLAKSIMGLLSTANISGSIEFLGNGLLGLNHKQFLDCRQDISMIFQDPAGSLSPRKTIGYSITEPYVIQNYKDKDLKSEANRLLKMVGLHKDFTDRYPYQLSGGQLKRVGVARALALNPKLIIADEPTAGLDVSIQGELLNLLQKIKDSTGLSIIIITHNLNIARHITNRIGIMYLGEFMEENNSEDIFNNTQHPYTLALLSANPVINFDNKIKKIKLKGETPSVMRRSTGCVFHQRCPFVRSKCKTSVPPQVSFKKNHSSRCFFTSKEIFPS